MLIKYMKFFHSHNETESAMLTHISITSSLWGIELQYRPNVSDQSLQCLLIDCSFKIWDFFINSNNKLSTHLILETTFGLNGLHFEGCLYSTLLRTHGGRSIMHMRAGANTVDVV